MDNYGMTVDYVKILWCNPSSQSDLGPDSETSSTLKGYV